MSALTPGCCTSHAGARRTICNGWEAYTKHDRTGGRFNREETHDFMPQMGRMVGYAVTVVCEPGNPEHPKANPTAWNEYRRHVAAPFRMVQSVMWTR
jgi:hypothetical protein